MNKISFVYSGIYDEVFKELYDKKKLEDQFGKYPIKEEISEYITKVKNIWSDYEEKVLNLLQQITGLSWKEEKVNCYVVGWVVPFSDPLTVPMYRDYPDYFIDVLIHELIHNLLIQNEKELKGYWVNVEKEFPDTSMNFRAHIPVHAIHEQIYKKLFREKRLKRDQELLNHLDDYRRSWDVVKDISSEKILDEIRKIQEDKR